MASMNRMIRLGAFVVLGAISLTASAQVGPGGGQGGGRALRIARNWIPSNSNRQSNNGFSRLARLKWII